MERESKKFIEYSTKLTEDLTVVGLLTRHCEHNNRNLGLADEAMCRFSYVLDSILLCIRQ